MATDLREATVVITGTSSGMGLAIALAYAQRGANLILSARREGPLKQACRAGEALGVRHPGTERHRRSRRNAGLG